MPMAMDALNRPSLARAVEKPGSKELKEQLDEPISKLRPAPEGICRTIRESMQNELHN